MFVSYHNRKDTVDDYSYIDEYNLSRPYDIASSGTYAGDDERCEFNLDTNGIETHRLLFFMI